MKKLALLMTITLGLFMASCEKEQEEDQDSTSPISVVGKWKLDQVYNGTDVSEPADSIEFKTDGSTIITTGNGAFVDQTTYEVRGNQLHILMDIGNVIFENKLNTPTRLDFETNIDGDTMEWIFRK